MRLGLTSVGGHSPHCPETEWGTRWWSLAASAVHLHPTHLADPTVDGAGPIQGWLPVTEAAPIGAATPIARSASSWRFSH